MIDIRTLIILMVCAIICMANIVVGLIATEGQVFNTGALQFIGGGFAAGIGCAIIADVYTE